VSSRIHLQFEEIPCKFPVSRDFEAQTGSNGTASSATDCRIARPFAVSAQSAAFPGVFRESRHSRDGASGQISVYGAHFSPRSQVAIFQCPGFMAADSRDRFDSIGDRFVFTVGSSLSWSLARVRPVQEAVGLVVRSLLLSEDRPSALAPTTNAAGPG
jgi:hypothetical protein